MTFYVVQKNNKLSLKKISKYQLSLERDEEVKKKLKRGLVVFSTEMYVNTMPESKDISDDLRKAIVVAHQLSIARKIRTFRHFE